MTPCGRALLLAGLTERYGVSVFNVNVDDFGPKLNAAKPGVPVLKEVVVRIGKTRPAGLVRGT